MKRNAGGATRGKRGRPKKAKTEEEETRQPKEEEASKSEETQQSKAEEASKSSGEQPSQPKTEGEKKGSVLLETGRIYFFYRPKVGVEEVKSFKDVQRLYVVLKPERLVGAEVEPKEEEQEASKCRLMVIPKKKLPDLKERFFGFIETIAPTLDKIKEGLGEKKYTVIKQQQEQEKTLQATRIAGEGLYNFVDFHSHVHLAYVLEIPQTRGPVQEALNIKSEESFVISVKNPEYAKSPDQPMRTGISERVKWPQEMQDLFRERRWLSPRTTKLFDYEGVEFILIGASDDIVLELGEVAEALEGVKQPGLTSKEALGTLKMSKGQVETKPMTKGEWV